MNNIINDGYTRDGFLEGIERLHGPLTFRFRPMLPSESDLFSRDDFRSRHSAQCVRMISVAVAEHVVEWDEAVPINAENVARLPWQLFNRLFSVVAGFAACDPLPNAAADQPEQDEYTKHLLTAATTGQPIGTVAAVADGKNSAKG